MIQPHLDVPTGAAIIARMLVSGSETTRAPNNADLFAISLAATTMLPANRPLPMSCVMDILVP